jgi:CHAT domain-containing protein/tetratricopeptide (TPR) repeat protein
VVTTAGAEVDGEALLETIERIQQLDRALDSDQIVQEFLAVRGRVDPGNQGPWAGLHAMVAPMLPAELAVEAYTIAIAWFRQGEDDGPLPDLSNGLLIAWREAAGAVVLDPEYVIELHELAIREHPFWSLDLAGLYANRVTGDALANWSRRVELLEQSVAGLDPERESLFWANANEQLALAVRDEPGGDFVRINERRIELHRRSLACLGDDHIEFKGSVHINLAEALLYVDPVGHVGELSPVEAAREQVALALACADAADSSELRQLATQMHGQIALVGQADEAMLRESFRQLTSVGIPAAQSNDVTANQLKSQALAAEALFDATSDPTEREELWRFVGDVTDRGIALLDQPTRDRYELRLVHGRVARRHGHHHEAIESYAMALDDAHHMLAPSASIEGRLESLRLLAEPSGALADCHLTVGDVDAAIQALERGRCQLWPQPAQPDLDPCSLVRDDEVIVLCCFANAAGWAVVVTPTEKHLVPLADIGAADFATDNPSIEIPNVLILWIAALTALKIEEDGPAFDRTLQAIAHDLGARFWSPVIDKIDALGLDEVEHITLLNHGVDGLLPFHAAALGDPVDPTFVVDRFTLSTALSLAQLAGSDRSSPLPAAPKVTVIADPNDNLAFEQVDIVGVETAFSAPQMILGSAADSQAVLQAFETSDLVHIAAHGAHDHVDVWSSVLDLADRQLTLGELAQTVRSQSSHPRVVVLASCETGQIKVTAHNNEALGFAPLLVLAGVETAVAPGWACDDLGAAIFATKFHQLVATGVSPERAVSLAQRWVRSAPAGEFAQIMSKIERPDADVARWRDWWAHPDGDADEFRAPWIWSAFTAVSAR